MNVTPALHVKNEEYWIYYVLRDLFKVFGHVVMIDTGSTDCTVEIAQATAAQFSSRLDLEIVNMGNDAFAIGNCPNMLRERVPVNHWMLLVDGDEIWGETQLRALLEIEPIAGTLVGMCNGRNVTTENGQMREREGFSADRLFASPVRWLRRTDYPFQSHGLEDKVHRGLVFHTNFERSYFWHVRHLDRSSRDAETFYRSRKFKFFGTGVVRRELPADWIGEIGPWPNPYLGVS